MTDAATRLREAMSERFRSPETGKWVTTVPFADLVAILETRTVAGERPNNCRNRLRDEGKPYPKSGCGHCKDGGLRGCPFEKIAASAPAGDERDETTFDEVVHRIREGVFYDDYDWASGPALRALDAALRAVDAAPGGVADTCVIAELSWAATIIESCSDTAAQSVIYARIAHLSRPSIQAELAAAPATPAVAPAPNVQLVEAATMVMQLADIEGLSSVYPRTFEGLRTALAALQAAPAEVRPADGDRGGDL